MYLFSKHSLIRYDCCVSIGLLLQNLAGRILTQKTMIQSILYSQLVCFTYIYLSEARTSAKYRNKTGKLLTNTEETFTSRNELRRADQSTYIQSIIMIFSEFYILLYYNTQLSEEQCTFKHNIPDGFIRKIDLQATDQ